MVRHLWMNSNSFMVDVSVYIIYLSQSSSITMESVTNVDNAFNLNSNYLELEDFVKFNNKLSLF